MAAPPHTHTQHTSFGLTERDIQLVRIAVIGLLISLLRGAGPIRSQVDDNRALKESQTKDVAIELTACTISTGGGGGGCGWEGVYFDFALVLWRHFEENSHLVESTEADHIGVVRFRHLVLIGSEDRVFCQRRQTKA